MREVVTLQLGHLSNYTATHFWNTQESYFTYSGQDASPIDHNVHWREGLGADGSETFLPRTVIYDLKGGFGSLRKTNALFEPELDDTPEGAYSLWSRQAVTHKEPLIEPSAYQVSLDSGTAPSRLTSSTVRYWSDFTRVFYHPKSVNQLHDFELNSTIQPFERHHMGAELFDSIDKENDIVDRDFRPFAEECDRMEGIQVFTTLDDAWGGFSSKYLDALRDEFPKTCIWLWGLQSPTAGLAREKRLLRQLNVAHALVHSASSASMIAPLRVPERGLPPNMEVDVSSQWNVSALFATAVDSALLEYRMAPRAGRHPSSLWDTVQTLNHGGSQRVAGLQIAVGQRANEADNSQYQADLLGFGQLDKFPTKDHQRRVFGEATTLRWPKPSAEERVEEADDPPLNRLGQETYSHSFHTDLRFPLLDSFPNIYSGDESSKIDVKAVLSTEKAVGSRIKQLQVASAGSVPRAEREDLSNGLSELIDAYQDGWSSGTDEDDDDA